MNDKCALERLITDPEWRKLLHDLRLRDEDRYRFGAFVSQYRYLRRPQKIDYRKLRAELSKALKAERDSRKLLEQTVANDTLFSAIASERDFIQIAGRLTSTDIRHGMETELKSKDRLLDMYETVIEGLGGRLGAKGNEAFRHLICSISIFLHQRIGRFLSASNEDISLVWQVAEIADRGDRFTHDRVKDKIQATIYEELWRYAPGQPNDPGDVCFDLSDCVGELRRRAGGNNSSL
jgi:hypothetical protein